MHSFIFRYDSENAKAKQTYDFLTVKGAFGDMPFFRGRPLSKSKFETYLMNNVPPEVRENLAKILPLTLTLAEKYQIDPFWVLAIMWAESHYELFSQSPKGALGLMQIMPSTQNYLSTLIRESPYSRGKACQDIDLFLEKGGPFEGPYKAIYHPSANVEMGIVYLKCLLKIFRNNSQMATMAYNMGPGRTKKHLVPSNTYLRKVRKAYDTLSLNLEYF